ncbi:MAG: glycosyltransferase family 9 protein [Desulfomonilaceae bacterium]
MNIWVIRPGALGDTILTIPLLYAIKDKYPTARITLLGSRPYQDILPNEFDFIAVDNRDSVWLFEAYHKTTTLKTKPCDMAYVILRNPDIVISNLRHVGVHEIISASPIPFPNFHLIETLHIQLGFPIPPRRPILENSRSDHTENICWIHPGSGGTKKLAPLKLFRAISNAIKNKTGCKIVITLGEADSHLKKLEYWRLLLQESHAELIENRPLKEICNHLARAKYFIGNDSGISHLAAQLGILSVLFFVNSDPVQWSPWTNPNQVLIVNCRNRILNEDMCTHVEEEIKISLGTILASK